MGFSLLVLSLLPTFKLLFINLAPFHDHHQNSTIFFAFSADQLAFLSLTFSNYLYQYNLLKIYCSC